MVSRKDATEWGSGMRRKSGLVGRGGGRERGVGEDEEKNNGSWGGERENRK